MQEKPPKMIHLNEIMWYQDPNEQFERFNQLIQNSSLELNHLIKHIDEVRQLEFNLSDKLSESIETSYLTKKRLTTTKALNVDSCSRIQSNKLLDQNDGLSNGNTMNGDFVDVYNFQLDYLADISFAKESLSSQISSKILNELNTFKTTLGFFTRQSINDMNSQLTEYTKALKNAQSKHVDYVNKCSQFEQLNDGGNSSNPLSTRNTTNNNSNFDLSTSSPIKSSKQQESALQMLTQSISNAISRQNSDDEDSADEEYSDEARDRDSEEDNGEDPYAQVHQLKFPIKFGSSTFNDLNELKNLFLKINQYSSLLERNANKASIDILHNKVTDFDNVIYISNIELAKWLKTNRPKTENSIKNIEAFGQALINSNFIKIPVFKNSLFKTLLSSKFQAADSKEITVYEFSKIWNLVITYDPSKEAYKREQKAQRKLQKKLQTQELKVVKKERKAYEESRASRRHSINQQDASFEAQDTENVQSYNPQQDTSFNTSLVRSTSTHFTNYLTSQFKSLSLSNNVDAKKETFRGQVISAEEQFLLAVADLNIKKAKLETTFNSFMISYEPYVRKLEQIKFTSLNYLSYLLMKHSEYEFQKLTKLNAVVTKFNQDSNIQFQVNNNILNNSNLSYLPFLPVMKFEKNPVGLKLNVSDEEFSLINSTSLFGSDVSLLPQSNDTQLLQNYSVPIIFEELLGYIKEGNFWIAALDISTAYSYKQLLLSTYEELQQTELNSQLNSVSTTKIEFQKKVIKRVVHEVFNHDESDKVINVVKLWLLELPDSLISFTIFEKLASLYNSLYTEVLSGLYNNNDKEFFKEFSKTDSEFLKICASGLNQRLDYMIKVFNSLPRSSLACLYIFLNKVSSFQNLSLFHILCRPPPSKVAFITSNKLRYQFMQKLFSADLENFNVLLPRLHDLIEEKESHYLRNIKLKQMSRSISIASPTVNKLPAIKLPIVSETLTGDNSLSKLNTSSDAVNNKHTRQVSSGLSTPTIMVDGLALRSFGTKNRIPMVSTGFSEATEASLPLNNEDSFYSNSSNNNSFTLDDSAMKTSKSMKRSSFGLFGNTSGIGIKIISSEPNKSQEDLKSE